MNLKDIKDLIEFVDSKGFAEFEIKRQGFRLRMSRFKEPGSQVVQSAPPIIISSPVAPAADVISQGQRRGLPEAPMQVASTPAPKESGSSANEAPLHVIKSPIVGTFYSAPSPTSEAFVRIGDQIESDTVVCIIEAMKLMNEIQAEVRGEVARIYVEDGQPVEFGQSLFGIKT